MTDIQLTPHFKMSEFTNSEYAKSHNIRNVFQSKYMTNLTNLVNVLETIRQRYGLPITVTSGYRSKALNTALGGVSNSDHLYGAAADIKGKYSNRGLWNLIVDMINNNDIEVRQLIWEKGTTTEPAWIHISVNNMQNSYRHNQILKLI